MLNFEPNLKIATPLNYILGPGDEIQVTIFGVQEFNTAVSVSVEGNINIQNVGTKLTSMGISIFKINSMV